MCHGWLTHRERVPGARFVAVGFVSGRAFAFHKKSSDGSGKGDAQKTGNPNDRTWGILVEVDPAEKEQLDDAEGLGAGYHEENLDVVTEDGESHQAFAYIADEDAVDRTLRPYHWYRRLVVEGAERRGLPGDYVTWLRSFESVSDPRPGRTTKLRAEYCEC